MVAGLTLAGASAVSHDLYASVIAKGKVSEDKEIRLSKLSAVIIGIVAIMLGYIFENQNVAFMVGLAFAVAASCNFPVLLMSVFWKGTTSRGALIGGLLGLASAVVMVVLSPAVWVKTFGFKAALFPYDNPALFSMTIAFVGIWLFSKIDASARARAEQGAFEAQYVRSETGIGAAEAPWRTSCLQRPTVGGRRSARMPAIDHSPLLIAECPMPQSFDSHNPPFDRLTHDEINELRAALDIGYFRPGEGHRRAQQRLRAPARHHQGLGRGARRRRRRAILGPKDSFDARAVVHGAAGARFIAAEETLCYLAPQSTHPHPDPAQSGLCRVLLFGGFTQARQAIRAGRRPEGVDSVLRARVRTRAPIRPCSSTARRPSKPRASMMRERDNNALFVRDGERIGIVTGMNLSKAVVLDRRPLDAPVRAICHFDVVSVEQDDFIFEALILMTRHNKRRLAVTRATAVLSGVLEDIDILGLVAGNSQLVPGRIDRAQSIDDLAQAAQDIQGQVERLAGERVRVDAIAEITSDLNRATRRPSCSRWSRRHQSATPAA